MSWGDGSGLSGFSPHVHGDVLGFSFGDGVGGGDGFGDAELFEAFDVAFEDFAGLVAFFAELFAIFVDASELILPVGGRGIKQEFGDLPEEFVQLSELAVFFVEFDSEIGGVVEGFEGFFAVADEFLMGGFLGDFFGGGEGDEAFAGELHRLEFFAEAGVQG